MQITTGLRGLLSSPAVYDLSQSIMGAGSMRRTVVQTVLAQGNSKRILDVGCGTAEILRYLPSHTEYFGFDISEVYIESAKRKYGARGRFYCELLSEARLFDLPKFDVVLAIGVLHHLDDEEARQVLHLASLCLDSNGRFISVDPCFAQNQNPLAKFLISRDRGQNVRTESGYRSIPQEIFSSVRGDLRHRAWIPYTHWFMECVK